MHFARRVHGIQNSDIRRWTNLIESKGGINLAQGICHIEPQPDASALVEEVRRVMEKGWEAPGYNTYSHYSGVAALREAIAAKVGAFNGIEVNPDGDEGGVIVTNGAAGALACANDVLIDPGDEVILFQPFYSYHPSILALRGGVPRFVDLHPPDWSFDPADLHRAWSPRTKAVLVNTPGNPSGKVFTREELLAIASFCTEQDLWAITDEVYEFMTYDSREHVSLATLPGMKERTITITSFSKTLRITGWRLGYALAPPTVARKLGLVNEYNYVCAPTPLQHAIARFVRDPAPFRSLGPLFQRKREVLCNALQDAGFRVYQPQGAYYVLADFSGLGFADDVTATQELINRVGVGAVPGSAFFADSRGLSHLRFCFAFTDEGLCEAARRLRKL